MLSQTELVGLGLLVLGSLVGFLVGYLLTPDSFQSGYALGTRHGEENVQLEQDLAIWRAQSNHKKFRVINGGKS